MKCLIVFAIICAVALAQREGGLERFIGEEVRAIIRANPSITLADCTAKCDAVFALDVPRDEEVTDRDCARECRIIHLTVAMKCLIVFAVVCVVALAQREGGLERFIGEEVRAIIRANPSITLADCTAKCDAVFALDVPRDEEITDRDCARECRILVFLLHTDVSPGTKLMLSAIFMSAKVLPATCRTCNLYTLNAAFSEVPKTRLVRDQVHALLQATPTLSVADCTAKCDAVFALDVPREEELTDQDCARECQRQIHGEPTGPPRASHGP
ncbi:hypothetical protein C0Q70_03623 [Pomacea canaliculata]|uniref:Uncharacterized protein n=1 Tax=Pomacea canaliculata TaxID=400727 RepID=A0A2T7PTC5_POMCA|nr:hypothetical protein C0Q70_03623 [Pomacea canaliculata]